MALPLPKSSASSERVKVIVRARPLSRKEIDEGHVSVVEVFPETGDIQVQRPISSSNTGATSEDPERNTEHKVFSFDAVYDGTFSQAHLYEQVFRPLVDSVLEGFNGTIFAYGQTGTGKTYTMEGSHQAEETQGVIPNAFKHIFKHISLNEEKRYLVRASYLEIYQEEIRDLLSKDGIKKCELKENRTGVYVKDLSSFLCGNFNEINELMAKGNKNRAVGATNMNEHSSRSHAIFMITVEVSEIWPDGRNHFKVGKLNLVDLAGSERQAKTGAVGERLKEATKINLSLSALGNVIAALVDGKSTHIPYRDSKLTRLLQDSLGGNSRTIMVATVGPANFNYDETITTLRYASRAKRIKNKPKVNEDPKDAMLREYQEEIARLRSQLLQKKAMYNGITTNDHGGGEGNGGENNFKGRIPRTRARTAVTMSSASSTSSSSEQMMRHVESQRLQELAPVLQSYGLDPGTDPKYIMTALEKRREALLKDTETVKEEKDRLLRKLEETQQRVKMTETECGKLSERIEWLESKVLNGGKSLLDHTNEQQKLIEIKQQELEESRLREEGIRLKLAEHELTANEIKAVLLSQQSQIEVKVKKLQKLRFKLHTTREELDKSHKDYERQRKHLIALQFDLRRELKLKRLIIDNFVPTVIRKIVETRIQQKEKEDGYYLEPIESALVLTLKRPPMNKSLKLPLFHRSDSGTVHAFEGVHYQDENILQLQLEMPKHLTTRYIPPRSNPYITSLMKRAFELAEQETVIDVGRHSHRKRGLHSLQSQSNQGPHLHLIPSESKDFFRKSSSRYAECNSSPYK